MSPLGFYREDLPDFIRFYNGSEFKVSEIKNWLKDLGVRTMFIEPGNPWENGYI